MVIINISFKSSKLATAPLSLIIIGVLSFSSNSNSSNVVSSSNADDENPVSFGCGATVGMSVLALLAIVGVTMCFKKE